MRISSALTCARSERAGGRDDGPTGTTLAEGQVAVEASDFPQSTGVAGEEAASNPVRCRASSDHGADVWSCVIPQETQRKEGRKGGRGHCLVLKFPMFFQSCTPRRLAQPHNSPYMPPFACTIWHLRCPHAVSKDCGMIKSFIWRCVMASSCLILGVTALVTCGWKTGSASNQATFEPHHTPPFLSCPHCCLPFWAPKARDTTHAVCLVAISCIRADGSQLGSRCGATSNARSRAGRSPNHQNERRVMVFVWCFF